MSEQQYDPQQEADDQEVVKQYPIKQSMTFAGGTFAVASLVDVLAHLGPTGLLVSGLAGFVAWRHGPELYEYVQARWKDAFPSTPAGEDDGEAADEQEDESRPRQGRSLPDRAISRFPDNEETAAPTKQQEPPRKTSGTQQSGSRGQQWEDAWYDEDGEDDEGDLPALASSAPFTLSRLLDEGFVPSLDHILLARLPDRTLITVAAKDLCHVALAGNTGGGKGVILRLIVAQLCHLRVPVLLLNPHYMRYDQEQDEDWTPYEPYLQRPPLLCRSYQEIERYLAWMAHTLLPKRIERRARGGAVGKPYFIVLDELPAIVAEIKQAPKYLGKILREGRKYGIYLISASQDFLVKTVAADGEGAVRKCYRTAFYVGGDSATARLLLNLPPSKIPENQLGKGTVMLRCAATGDAVLAHVPYVDNASLYRLLGPSTYHPSEETSAGEDEDELGRVEGKPAQSITVAVPMAQPSKPVPAQQGNEQGVAIPLSLDKIITLFEQGKISETALLALMSRLPAVSSEEGEDEEPGQEQEQQVETEQLPDGVVAFPPTRQPSTALSPQLQRAYEAFESGMSYRDLAAALKDINKDTAGRLIRELQRRKLISNDEIRTKLQR